MGKHEKSSRAVKMELWLQGQLEDLADMGVRSQDLAEKKTKDAIPTLAKQSSPSALARCLSRIAKKFEKPSLEDFLKTIQNSESDFSERGDPFEDVPVKTLVSLCEKARRNAEVLEVFAQLRDVRCNTKEELCASLDALHLPHTLESARKVVEHKRDILQKVRNVLTTVGALLKKAPNKEDRTTSADAAALMLHQLHSDKAFTGNEEEVVELENRVRKTLSFHTASKHTVELSQFDSQILQQDETRSSQTSERAMYDSEGLEGSWQDSRIPLRRSTAPPGAARPDSKLQGLSMAFTVDEF